MIWAVGSSVRLVYNNFLIGNSRVGVLRLCCLPLIRLESDSGGESCSSSTSLSGPPIRSRRPLAALSRRRAFASASLSFRLRSLLFSFRSSFSTARAHQPANGSHRCASTFSMTLSISTPADRILSKVSFSIPVLNGAGCVSLRITCCCGACSARKGFVRISARVGRISGRFDSIETTKALTSAGKSSGHLGSVERILCFVTRSSSSSKGSSPVSNAYSMMPRLQTSTFSPAYFSPFSISGAL